MDVLKSRAFGVTLHNLIEAQKKDLLPDIGRRFMLNWLGFGFHDPMLFLRLHPIMRRL